MVFLQNISYTHPDRDLLFDNIHLTINKQEKASLVGNNGSGKSTLLKIIAGDLQPSGGVVQTSSKPYYVPQLFGQFNGHTIAQALRIGDTLGALHRILAGDITESNISLLNDDWSIEERCREALTHWGLQGLDLTQQMKHLSGGQKTKAFLAGIAIHQPEIVLLDEPTNHLDEAGRQLLYDLIETSASTLIAVSHDRRLLNLFNAVFELTDSGITVYGGNYDFYAGQKLLERNALNQVVRSQEKALRKAREVGQEMVERRQKLDARGKRKQEKAGLPTISMNALRNNAEKSTSRTRDVHAAKVEAISQELDRLRKTLPDADQMKIGFDNASLHSGKILVTAKDINQTYGQGWLWKEPVQIRITSRERVALKGLNGSGKTTLIKIILGEIEPATGTIHRAHNNAVYIDQDYSLIDDQLSVYQQADKHNISALQEHQVKIRLNRFLFTREYWDKPCSTLSGGEKMRLMLCCLTIRSQSPDLIILDEPTNNLDIQNVAILTDAVKEYKGALIVVSHDQYFLEQVNVPRSIYLQ